MTNADPLDHCRVAATVHLVCGLNGAGKTTFARRLRPGRQAVGITADGGDPAQHASVERPLGGHPRYRERGLRRPRTDFRGVRPTVGEVEDGRDQPAGCEQTDGIS